MKRYGIVAAIAALVATIGLVVIGAPAHAADCRYDQWGSSPWKGQKYKCKDGSSLYIKPPYSNAWDDVPQNSWETWRGQDSNGNRYNCRFDDWRGTWRCT